MRCLKPQIDERPASALAVAAALPGGDPLAAALAAGETPSPEMVAAAGQTDAAAPGDRPRARRRGARRPARLRRGRRSPPALRARADAEVARFAPGSRARHPGVARLSAPPASTRRADCRSTSTSSRTSRDTSNAPEPLGRAQPAHVAGHALLVSLQPAPARAASARTGRRPGSDPPMTIAGMTRMELDDTGRLRDVRGRAAARRGPSRRRRSRRPGRRSSPPPASTSTPSTR